MRWVLVGVVLQQILLVSNSNSADSYYCCPVACYFVMCSLFCGRAGKTAPFSAAVPQKKVSVILLPRFEMLPVG